MENHYTVLEGGMNMTSITALVNSVENEFGGSVNNAPLFDKRLVKTRKLLNGDIDPLDDKFHDFDFKSAQFMLNQGIGKKRISFELGVTQSQLNWLIRMGSLSDEEWRDITSQHVNSHSIYVLYRSGIKIAIGTISELAKQTGTNVGTVRYWKSSRYRNREHKVTYKILEA